MNHFKQSVGSILSLELIHDNGIRWSTSDGLVLQSSSDWLKENETKQLTLFTGSNLDSIYSITSSTNQLFAAARDGNVRKYALN